MKRIIITGCEGLIGSSIKKYLMSKNYDCLGLDIQLGHDLSDEEFVKDYFKNRKVSREIPWEYKFKCNLIKILAPL